MRTSLLLSTIYYQSSGEYSGQNFSKFVQSRINLPENFRIHEIFLPLAFSIGYQQSKPDISCSFTSGFPGTLMVAVFQGCVLFSQERIFPGTIVQGRINLPCEAIAENTKKVHGILL